MLEEMFAQLEESLKAGRDQMVEFEKGKKAACGRLRKEAQESKKLWQAIRMAAMAKLKEMPTKKRVKKV